MNSTFYTNVNNQLQKSYTRLLGCMFIMGMILFGNIQEAFASHVVGSDVSYKCTGTAGVWEITLVIYRKCDGGSATLCPTTCGAGCPQTMQLMGADPSCANQTFGNIALSLVSVRDVNIDLDCPTAKNTCTNMGCVAAGTYTPAVERYEFKGFADTRGVPASCCNVRFSWELCCRNSNIETGARDANFYVDAVINRCHSLTPCNNSPTLTNDPFAIICGGENYVFNNGAVDPDLDSLSYSFTPALASFGGSVPYTSPFAFDRPMPWTGAAEAPFPAGIHCDPLNGDIMFTPLSSGGLFAGVMAVEIKQWKLIVINGVPTMTVVGITRRDIQMVVRGDCLPNNPPRLITNPPEDGNINIPKTNWSVCAGDQLCFTITAKDTDFNPPTISDTTYLSWNAALAAYGATFKPTYDPAKRRLPASQGGGPREDQYQFCWTPAENRASTTPYYFTVSAKDKRCPNPGRVTRAFSVLVIGKADLKINKSNLKCGKWGFTYTNLSPKFTPKITQWQISSVPGDYYMSSNPHVFNNTANPGSIQFSQGGRYYILLKAVTDGPIGSPGCEKFIRDSFDVDSVMLVLKRDTLACAGKSVLLTAAPKHGIPPVTYRWFNSIKDTATSPLNSNVNISDFTVTTPVTRYYTIQLKDLNGCKAHDSVKVEAKPLPIGTLPTSARICAEDTFVLDPGNNSGNIKKYLWNVGDSTRTVAGTDSGLYIVTITDTFNCAQKDSMMLYVNLKVAADLGIDKAICEGTSTTLKATGGYMYAWRNLNGTPAINVPKGYSDTLSVKPTNSTIPTQYEVKAYLSYPDTTAKFKECWDTDTIEVTVNPLPKLIRPASTQVCLTAATATLPLFRLDPTQFPSQGTGSGVWTYPPDPSAILTGGQVQVNKLKNAPANDTLGSFDNWLRYTFTGPPELGGCSKVDSAIVRIYGIPPTNAGLDKMRCDIAGVYEITKTHGYSPQSLPLHTGEVWVGPGVGSYVSGGITYYTFNPTGLPILPAKNTLEYQYTHTYNNPVTDPDKQRIQCYKADQVDIGITAAPKIEVTNDLLVCADEPTFLIKSKATDAKITPAVGTAPYWEAADVQLVNAKAGVIGGQSFNAASATSVLPILNNNYYRSYLVYFKDTSTGCVVKDSIKISVARVPQVNLTYNDVTGADSPYVCLNTKSVLFKMESTTPTSSTTYTEPTGGMQYSVSPTSGLAAFGASATAPKHEFNSTKAGPGTYWLKMKHTNNQQAGALLGITFAGCSASDSTLIIVQDTPSIAVTAPSSICTYDALANVSLSTVPVPNYGFTWVVEAPADGSYTNATASSTTYAPGAADKAAGIVTIKARSVKDSTLRNGGRANGDQCPEREATQVLNIYPAPAAVIIPIDSAGCVPFTGNYAAGPTGVETADFNWSWDGVADADKDSLISRFIKDYDASAKGKYSLGLTVKATYGTTECSTTATPKMMVTHPLPYADYTAEPKSTTIAKPFFNFIDQSSVVDGSKMSYLWNLGPGPDSKKPGDRIVTVANPTNIEYAADTAWQKVTLKVTTEFGCADSTVDSVRIEPDITVFIPNAFRPRGKDGNHTSNAPCPDGLENCNEYFRVVANGQLSLEVFIYNRWGQLVFKSTNPNEGWDGTVMNQGAELCPQDVYVYQVNATSYNGKAYKYSGSITLLR